MAVISFTAGELGARLRADVKGAPKAVLKAMKSAAHRGRAIMIEESPVYRGIMRNAWKVVAFADAVELVNDQPYAGVIERGARPFKISPEGFQALRLWVKRKIFGAGRSFDTRAWKWHKSAAQARAKADRASGRNRRRSGPVRTAQAIGQQMIDKEIDQVTWAIVRKWARVGMQGKFFVRRNLPRMSHAMDKEIGRFLSDFFNRSR